MSAFDDTPQADTPDSPVGATGPVDPASAGGPVDEQDSLHRLRLLQHQYFELEKEVRQSGFSMLPEEPGVSWPAVVGLRLRLLQPVQMRGFLLRLGRTILEDFGDSLVVLRAVPGGSGPPVSITSDAGVPILSVATPWGNAEAALVLAERIRDLLPRPSCVLLDLADYGANAIAIQSHLGEAKLGPYQRRLVVLAPINAEFPRTVPGWTSVHVHQLRSTPPAPEPGLGKLASWAKDWAFGANKPQGGAAYPAEHHPTYGCRVHFSQLEGDLADGKADPVSWSRLGRAVTDRLVGLAFGGSGAWGYAVLPMVREMFKLGIPIDYVAGVSSGSVMGAYLAAYGEAGCDLVEKRCGTLTATVTASFLSPWFLQAGVGYDMGALTLQELEVMFLPVASNVSKARPEWIEEGPVAWGVRASGSAPGGFGPTIVPDGQYVDGAITDNVPVTLLQRFGARFIVAVNAIPAPLDSPPPAGRGLVRGALRALNPLQRVLNFQTSFALMVHDVGDYEMNGSAVYYDAPQEFAPLLRTLSFFRASEIIDKVRTDSGFAVAVADMRERWGLLSSPRRACA